jgi:hypothetical protein
MWSTKCRQTVVQFASVSELCFFRLHSFTCLCGGALVTLQDGGHTSFAYGTHCTQQQINNNSKQNGTIYLCRVCKYAFRVWPQ